VERLILNRIVHWAVELAIENQTVKWLIIGVLTVLLVVVIVMLGMKAFGAAGSGGMISNMAA
jgi:hypothetical protein